jgi:hypothetical protein
MDFTTWAAGGMLYGGARALLVGMIIALYLCVLILRF